MPCLLEYILLFSVPGIHLLSLSWMWQIRPPQCYSLYHKPERHAQACKTPTSIFPNMQFAIQAGALTGAAVNECSERHGLCSNQLWHSKKQPYLKGNHAETFTSISVHQHASSEVFRQHMSSANIMEAANPFVQTSPKMETPWKDRTRG